MTKPDDIPQDVWDYGAAVVHVYCGCAAGRHRNNGTAHHDSCWKQVEAHARAIMEEREACAQVAVGLSIRHRVKQSDAMEADRPESHLLHALFASKLDEVAAAIRNRSQR